MQYKNNMQRRKNHTADAEIAAQTPMFCPLGMPAENSARKKRQTDERGAGESGAADERRAKIGVVERVALKQKFRQPENDCYSGKFEKRKPVGWFGGRRFCRPSR